MTDKIIEFGLTFDELSSLLGLHSNIVIANITCKPHTKEVSIYLQCDSLPDEFTRFDFCEPYRIRLRDIKQDYRYLLNDNQSD